ncbi:MAG: acetate--CoA ligase family protein, partial [Nitrososphaeraceae archaeon]
VEWTERFANYIAGVMQQRWTKLFTQGVRGEKQSDIKKLAECIERISQLATDFPQIKELDLNPTVVFEEGKGCKVVDVRIGLS